MVRKNNYICPKCGGVLRYYDKTNRKIRVKYGKKKSITIRRLKCVLCGALHRELPNYIFPNKHYHGEIINGVLENLITSETLGFEDYPCEMTMRRWKSH